MDGGLFYLEMEMTQSTIERISIMTDVLRNKNLSARAKGVYACIMMLDESSGFNRKELVACSTEGRDAIYTAIRELIDIGLLHMKTNRERDGKLNGCVYTIVK